MSSNKVDRVAGVAAILAVLISLAAYVQPVALVIGALAMAVFIFGLYRNYRAESPTWSLVGGVLGIVGAVALAVLTLISPTQYGAAVSIATWAAFFLPPLVFGFLALRHPRADIPRILAIIGIVGGVFGLLNLVLTLIAGGDWSNPNNPALTPLLLGTYYLAMLPTLAWMVWTGIALLLRRK
jgi:hypothetical protein